MGGYSPFLILLSLITAREVIVFTVLVDDPPPCWQVCHIWRAVYRRRFWCCIACKTALMTPYFALLANTERTGLVKVTMTTPSRSSPQQPCSILNHTGKSPGIAMITAMATTMPADESRSRR